MGPQLMILPTPVCQMHGAALKRHSCAECNRVYMRDYQRHRRASKPEAALLERAKERARRLNIPYELQPGDITLPTVCPVLGIPLVVGGRRSPQSPSLDRIKPHLGYVPGNVRVVSNQANCLKGDKDLAELDRLARQGAPHFRRAYSLIADYVQREELLEGVRRKAAEDGRSSQEWAKVALFLERRFREFGVAGSISLAH